MKKSSQTTYTNLPKNNNSKINNEKTTSWTCISANLHFNWTWFETKKKIEKKDNALNKRKKIEKNKSRQTYNKASEKNKWTNFS